MVTGPTQPPLGQEWTKCARLQAKRDDFLRLRVFVLVRV